MSVRGNTCTDCYRDAGTLAAALVLVVRAICSLRSPGRVEVSYFRREGTFSLFRYDPLLPSSTGGTIVFVDSPLVAAVVVNALVRFTFSQHLGLVPSHARLSLNNR